MEVLDERLDEAEAEAERALALSLDSLARDRCEQGLLRPEFEQRLAVTRMDDARGAALLICFAPPSGRSIGRRTCRGCRVSFGGFAGPWWLLAHEVSDRVSSTAAASAARAKWALSRAHCSRSASICALGAALRPDR